jgi:pimeloyl-ACP methyl ester carboxylesterase
MKLIPSISNPILVLWGDEDPFTPINGPVGKYFQALPQINPKVQLYLLQGVGHCPHDDSPDLVHEKLLPWLANL